MYLFFSMGCKQLFTVVCLVIERPSDAFWGTCVLNLTVVLLTFYETLSGMKQFLKLNEDSSNSAFVPPNVIIN